MNKISKDLYIPIIWTALGCSCLALACNVISFFVNIPAITIIAIVCCFITSCLVLTNALLIKKRIVNYVDKLNKPAHLKPHWFALGGSLASCIFLIVSLLVGSAMLPTRLIAIVGILMSVICLGVFGYASKHIVHKDEYKNNSTNL